MGFSYLDQHKQEFSSLKIDAQEFNLVIIKLYKLKDFYLIKDKFSSIEKVLKQDFKILDKKFNEALKNIKIDQVFKISFFISSSSKNNQIKRLMID